MELFSLLAKLTLDRTDYDRQVSDVEKGKIEIPEAQLGLDTSQFDSEIDDANSTEVELEDPELGIDNQEFSTGLQESSDAADGFGEHVGSIFGQIKNALIAAGIVGVLSSITNLLSDAVKITSENADAIDKGSTAMNISKRGYQEWNHVLQQSGGSVSELTRGAKSLNAILSDVKTGVDQGTEGFDLFGLSASAQADRLKDLGVLTEDQANAFKKLGINLYNTNGELKTNEEIMKDALYAAADLDPESRISAINAIFGRNVKGLVNLAASGKEAIDDLFAEPESLGLIMSDEDVKHGVEYGDAMSNLNAEMTALKETFVSGILPVLTDAVKMVTIILSFFNGRAGKNTLADQMEEIDKNTAQTMRDIDTAQGEAFSLIDKLKDMGDYTKLSAEEQEKWNKYAERAVELYPELGKYIDKDTKSIKGNTDEIKDNIRQWSNMMKQRALSEAVQEKQNALAKKAAEAADMEIEAETKRAEAEGKRYAAIQEGNRLLEENAEVRAEYERRHGTGARLGEDATSENLTELYSISQEHYTEQSEAFDNLLMQYDDLNKEADSLEIKAAKANDEVEKETEHLEVYTEKAKEKYGILDDEMDTATSKAVQFTETLNNIPRIIDVAIRTNIEGQSGVKLMPQAIGDPYVPYDNYPSLLHRGERVLTATEARRYHNGDGADLSGLEDRIVSAIQEGLKNATVRSYLNNRDITDEVSQELERQLSSRRFG